MKEFFGLLRNLTKGKVGMSSSSSKMNGLDRKHSQNPHKYANTRRTRDERKPSIKDINELYSALQDLVNLPPSRPSKLGHDGSPALGSRDVSPSGRSSQRLVEGALEIEKGPTGILPARVKVTRAASSPSSSPRFRKKSATMPAKIDQAPSGNSAASVKMNIDIGKPVVRPSPASAKKFSKVAPIGVVSEVESPLGSDSKEAEDVKDRVRTSKAPSRARSRSTPGISKATAMKKLKEKQRKITESFSRKEKEIMTPTVIRNIDDLVELAKQSAGPKKTSPFAARKLAKKSVGEKDKSKKRLSDPYLTPDVVTSRLDDWYQKAVAKAIDENDLEDTEGTPSEASQTGSRKTSNVSLSSLTSLSSLNSYNSGCTDYSTTEDHDLVSSECRRFTEQLKSLDIGHDEVDYDSDNDSGVNVKPTIILVREKSQDFKVHVAKAASDTSLLTRYTSEDVDCSEFNCECDVQTSTPEKASSKPYFYIPNLTDDQKTNFTLVINYQDKEESSDEKEDEVDKTKVGMAQDSNFYHLQEPACKVVHRNSQSPKIRPKSYDIAESSVDVDDLVGHGDGNHDCRKQMSRTKSMYVGKDLEKQESCRANRNVAVDANENVLGIAEKKWWDLFKGKPQTETNSGRKKAKRKSSFKRN